MDAFWRALGDPRSAAVLIVGFCVAHLLIRLIAWPGFSADDAELYMYAQSWRWTYDLRHPPLLVWLARALGDVTNDSSVDIPILKYTLMAIGLAGYAAAASLVLNDSRLTALAVLGLLATPILFLVFHVEQQFNLLLGATTSFALVFLLQTLKFGRWRDYTCLGIAIALGFLSKYIFGIPLVAFGTSVALIPQLRDRIVMRRVLLTIGIAAALVLPLVWDLVSADYSLTGLTQRLMTKSFASHAPVGVTYSALSVLVASAEFIAPFAIPFLLVFFWKRPKNARANDSPYTWMLFMANFIGFAIMFAGAIAFHARGFKAYWMYPILLSLPIALMSAAKSREMPAIKLKVYGGVMMLAFIGSWSVHALLFELQPNICRGCYAYWPFKKFAHELSAKGFVRGTVRSEFFGIPGNLRRYFHDSRFVMSGEDEAIFGPPPEGAHQLLALSILSPKGALSLANPELHARGAIVRTGRLTERLDWTKDRVVTLYYVLVDNVP